ncbi:hypothetical protein TREMEDRAFT_66766 [Tremella mesenterica DSM 1558]|uniref:uncharacterized protein n=1 Tax=Tremella mesenterica (strain ATCC 24925 / CBS 8224 / DSM 1558 / NBRC 9311 / NRRL Y-6157 / RJB 2259-6 / UBC 559-6) TaxID=578456 RepID=UPI0003F4941E|nr:uncharacterized protein TREMEDRAFT_66766 [Tremella mesenterica DSM 1558]EIW72215.1 hypothetical protein TREMEDRAFT_66766 [Tremella mesenterica DSM 1558]
MASKTSTAPQQANVGIFGTPAGSSSGLSLSLSPTNPFRIRTPSFPTSKGKHKLSPSPSPKHTEEDFVMISPVQPPRLSLTITTPPSAFFNPAPRPHPQMSLAMVREDSSSSSSPPEESPTPCVASAAARLKLADDESPIRRVPGQSRSLRQVSGSIMGERKPPASPLKFSTVNLSMDEEMEDDDPPMPETPLLPHGPHSHTMPLFPLRTSISQESNTSVFLGKPASSNLDLPQSGQLSTLSYDQQNQEVSNTSGAGSRIPRLSASHALRPRSSVEAQKALPTLTQKKAASLGEIQSMSNKDEPFGSSSTIPFSASLPKKSRPGSMSLTVAPGRAHKRMNSGEHSSFGVNGAAGIGSISRSFGQKNGLALSLSPGLGHLPELSTSNSSITSMSATTTVSTPPLSSFSPMEPPIFENVKPLQEAFQSSTATVSRKFKPRDSGVAMEDQSQSSTVSAKYPPNPSAIRNPFATNTNNSPAMDIGGKTMGPPSMLRINTRPPRRPSMLKRTSSMGDERPQPQEVETPSVASSMQSGWPGAFGFLGDVGAQIALPISHGDPKPSMPGTPVKKSAYAPRVTHSRSHPTLPSESESISEGLNGQVPLGDSTRHNMPPVTRLVPPSTTKKPFGHLKGTGLALRTAAMEMDSSPERDGSDPASPTARLAPVSAIRIGGMSQPTGTVILSRVGTLERMDEAMGAESDDEVTPTKKSGTGDQKPLAPPRTNLISPTPSPRPRASTKTGSYRPTGNPTGPNGTIMPRLSLPAFAAPKIHRALHHRQSHPATSAQFADDDVFERKFITLETLGKGAFSTVVKVQERHGDGLFAVKIARGVFDGVRDRLRHLEEVDILRHLSKEPSNHVIRFEDAWEQNRQLFIQTELCLGSLLFFLEEYGQVVERMDEARVWKIVRELSDGIHHIHSHNVIHFDLKPANILISPAGSLKIADFGLAARWPRVTPQEVLEGSGLGGSVAGIGLGSPEKLEREGDRVYMAPEMLRGVFEMAADIFSFGLIVLEVSTNICVPDGGLSWQAIRSDDFSVVDLSPLSPALTDLITQCMRSHPSLRPTSHHLVSHPVIQRARSGGTALAPEEPMWLVEVLTGSGFVAPPIRGDGDVEMLDG